MLKAEYTLRGKIASTGGLMGPPGPQGEPGKDGAPGKDGYTPVKGKDYYTEEEKAELVEEIEAKVNSPVKSIAITEHADGSVTMVNTLEEGTETIVVSADAEGNPSGLTVNGVEIPIAYTKEVAEE